MNQQQSDFLKMAVPAAQAAQRKWGVPASVTIAQAILESAWGQSSLARLANNFFGIKAVGTSICAYVEFTTSEFVDGRRMSEMARFARYPSPTASFDAHAVLLASSLRYKAAMAVKDDAFAFGYALKSCGYSTNPAYGDDLKKLIDLYDLTQYDIQPDGPAAAAEAAA